MYKTVRNLTVFSLGLGVSAVVGWLLLKEKERERPADSVTIHSQSRMTEPDKVPHIVLPLEPVADTQPIPAADQETITAQNDDLTLISGIGTRFAEGLNAIGITRFADLATQDPDTLAEKLTPYVTVRAQRIRDNNWIGQALQRSQR